jgi:Ca2+-dependent lipid-binding protein
MDLNGKSDPYCVFHYNNETVKSSIKYKTISITLHLNKKDPTWNEKLQLKINKNKNKFIKIECWDKVKIKNKIKDNLKKDDYCGKGIIDVSRVSKDECYNIKLNLDLKGGVINFKLIPRNFGFCENDELNLVNQISDLIDINVFYIFLLIK